MNDSLLDEADHNYWRANGAFFGTSRIGGAAESGRLVLQNCGAPSIEFNVAHLKTPDDDLDAAITAARAYFEPLGLDYSIEVRSDRAHVCTPALRAAGFERANEVPSMIWPEDRVEASRRDTPREFTGLEIATVESDEELRSFQETSFEGFGLPAAAGSMFLTRQLQRRPDVWLYLGRIDGRPACTSALVQTGRMAGVYWVATLESFRGRGLGEIMTRHAALGGHELGNRVACLQASEMGRPVYERMGFETVAHYVRFRSKPEEASGEKHD